MSGHVRKVERPSAPPDWRSAQAAALEAGASAIDEGLARIDDLTALFDGDEEIQRSLRSVAGHLRTRRNDWISEARALRTAATATEETP